MPTKINAIATTTVDLTFRQCDFIPERERRNGDDTLAINEMLCLPPGLVVWTIREETLLEAVEGDEPLCELTAEAAQIAELGGMLGLEDYIEQQYTLYNTLRGLN